MSNSRNYLLDYIPADVPLTKLRWKWLCSLLELITKNKHQLSPLSCYLLTHSWAPHPLLGQIPGRAPLTGPGTCLLSCQWFQWLSLPLHYQDVCPLQPASMTGTLCIARASLCTWGLLLVKAEVILISDFSGKWTNLLQPVRGRCSSSQL